jgi:transposase
MRFITLSTNELRLLQEMELATISKPLRNRVQCILLSNKRVKVKDLSIYFEVSCKTIYLWLDLWDKAGANGLIHKTGTGRKAKLRDISVDVIKELVLGSPRNLKPVIVKLREIYQVEVSIKTLQRFLKIQSFQLA